MILVNHVRGDGSPTAMRRRSTVPGANLSISTCLTKAVEVDLHQIAKVLRLSHGIDVRHLAIVVQRF